MELQLNLEQKQIISQRMVQSMEILQMNTFELERYIEQLALENPVIELPSIDERRRDLAASELERKAAWLESSDYQNRVYYRQDNLNEDIWSNIKSPIQPDETLERHLKLQLLSGKYTQKERQILEYIICSLDEKGYFTEDIALTAQRFAVPEGEILKQLSYIQSLEPAGVGARNLKECLLIQLRRNKEENSLAEKLVESCLTELSKNHLQSAALKLHVSTGQVKEAYAVIKQLNPKPANSFAPKQEAFYIRPDCLVLNVNGSLELVLNERQQPEFSINEYYRELIKTTDDKEAKKYLQEKIAQAKWVYECIGQRKSTLRRVLEELIKRQEEFFFKGEGNKRPMGLCDLSESLNLHESTISRAMKGKYLQCSFGIYPLNYFLTQPSVKTGTKDEAVSADQVKSRIKNIVDKEDKEKPYSDQAICDLLEKDGVRISRRTVNKYRLQMNIPDKAGRKAVK